MIKSLYPSYFQQNRTIKITIFTRKIIEVLEKTNNKLVIFVSKYH